MDLIYHSHGGLGRAGDRKDETAVLKAASSLDPAALESLFDAYAPALYKYLLRLGLGSQEADQIVGDVFVRVLEKLSAGKGPQTNVRSYLFQIAYHLVVDQARDNQRAGPLEIAEKVGEESKTVPAQTEEKMLLESLSAVMEEELTEEQRNVIVLRFQEDFSLKETADIIGKNVNAVKALQNRAINKLREAMSHKHGEGYDA